MDVHPRPGKIKQVGKGESVDGRYPIGPKWRRAYEAWLKEDA